MYLKDLFFQSIASLNAHRLRAFLTLFGVAWGIVAVSLLLAYGNGLHQALFYGLRGGMTFGTVVIKGSQTSRQAGGERAGRPIMLDEDDVEAVKRSALIKCVSPEYTFPNVSISYENRHTATRLRGVAPEYAMMRNIKAQSGRFFNTDDIDNAREVAFLGNDLAHKLFGNRSPVGETIYIKGLPFEVIGLLANKAQLLSYEAHDRECVFIPCSAARRYWHQNHLSYLVFQIANAELHDQAVSQVRNIIASRYNFDAQDERALRVVIDSVENNRLFGAITDLLIVVLGAIGLITLLIGGVGVINIMLVSVMERTCEIGIRKALGATRSQILIQFLLEGLAITFLGGLIGMAIAYGLMSFIGPQPFLSDLLGDETRQTDIHLLLSLRELLTTAMLLVFVGLASGMWPALRASLMDPVKSLQHE
jgi:putative ABC transport system permease protein